MARGDNAFNAQLVRLPGVQAAVRGERDEIARRARSLFAAHDRPGGHRITTSTSPPDASVWLEGPAPRAVEFGHFTPSGDKYVDGLHILARAARR
ncbi:MAG: DUF5403 family protein [Actinomycetaceae bacterium]